LASLDSGEADVPCGSCTACCTSSQFIHVEPDERATLARIPAALLFPAPGKPKGHVLLGYDEHGRCPMFVDGGCSIYDHRPRTCRAYDCRVFAATGIVPDQPAVADRVRTWRFDTSAPRAVAIRRRARSLTDEGLPPLAAAVRAVHLEMTDEHV
jgi:Fe-S-cluster containining protein